MRVVVWAALQSMQTLQEVDRMIPRLVDESQLRYVPGRFKFRRGLKHAGKAHERTSSVGAGVSLTLLGVAMLIPGPVDALFAVAGGTVAGYFFGAGAVVTGAVIGIAIYNVVAVAVIVVGLVLIAKGLLGI